MITKTTTSLLLCFLLGSQLAQAETITCFGRTNNPNTTDMDFELEIENKEDHISGQNFYRSRIKYTLPDGSTTRQGFDLNGKPRVTLDKVIYTGSNSGSFLEFSFAADGSIQSSILNHRLLGMNQLPVKCEINGSLPQRPVCSNEIDKNKALLEALKGPMDLDKLETAIACGANVNKADANGCTPLMIAIEPTCGEKQAVQYPPSSAQALALVDTLLANGAFVAVADKNGETPVIKAAKAGLRDVYESFIAAEADFDAQDNLGNTALMYAAANGDAWIVEQILEGNPDRRLKNKDGKTAYDIAKVWERTKVMNLVRIPDSTVTIEGQADGSCSPLQIDLKQGQVIEFVLKATEKMFKLDAKMIGLDLMADGNGQDTQILSLDKKGTFNFTCGYHGANNASKGKITVK